MLKTSSILFFLLSARIFAQQNASNDSTELLRQVLSRLDRVEEQNRQLIQEIKSLKEQMNRSDAATSAPGANETPIEQRVSVAEQRIDEQAQTKVEASQRFPIRITGALLFNAFANTGAPPVPGYSPVLTGPEVSGATVRQTLLGLDFHGPNLPWNGKASGSLSLDLSGASSYGYGGSVNLRRAVLNLDWARRSFEVGQDKALISRRAPDSLAEVLLPPLSYSGNPWIWVPQVRYVERFSHDERMGVNIESSVLETDESLAYRQPSLNQYLQNARPAFEGRVEFWLRNGENRRFEIAPGFHVSTSHVGQDSVSSHFATLDWLVRPAKRIQITGLFAGGQNMANLGGFTNGFYLEPNYHWHAVRGAGGWTQVAIQLTPRLTWNSFAGLQAPQTSGLAYGALSHDYSFATNLEYRIAPNILLGAEALQERTGIVGQSHFIRDHYDLAVGYLF